MHWNAKGCVGFPILVMSGFTRESNSKPVPSANGLRGVDPSEHGPYASHTSAMISNSIISIIIRMTMMFNLPAETLLLTILDPLGARTDARRRNETRLHHLLILILILILILTWIHFNPIGARDKVNMSCSHKSAFS